MSKFCNDGKEGRMFWWCRECACWAEIDFMGICDDCRGDGDPHRRGATADDRAHLVHCGRCSS